MILKLTENIILEWTVVVIPKNTEVFEENLELFCTLVITGAYVEKRAQNKKVDLVYILWIFFCCSNKIPGNGMNSRTEGYGIK